MKAITVITWLATWTWWPHLDPEKTCYCTTHKLRLAEAVSPFAGFSWASQKQMTFIFPLQDKHVFWLERLINVINVISHQPMLSWFPKGGPSCGDSGAISRCDLCRHCQRMGAKFVDTYTCQHQWLYTMVMNVYDMIIMICTSFWHDFVGTCGYQQTGNEY